MAEPGVNGLAVQYARTGVTCQKGLLFSKSSRTLDQPAKQPQSRETARVLQKETQGRKSQQLDNEETKSIESRQVLDKNEINQ